MARHWPVHERYRVPPHRLPFKGGHSDWKQTSGIRQSISPFPSSSSRFRCMAVRLWHANKRLFLAQVPSKKKSNPKCALELPMGEWPWSTALARSLSLSLLPSLFLSFTHLFFFPSPLIRLILEMAERMFEGREMRARSGELRVRVTASWWHEL